MTAPRPASTGYAVTMHSGEVLHVWADVGLVVIERGGEHPHAAAYRRDRQRTGADLDARAVAVEIPAMTPVAALGHVPFDSRLAAANDRD